MTPLHCHFFPSLETIRINETPTTLCEQKKYLLIIYVSVVKDDKDDNKRALKCIHLIQSQFYYGKYDSSLMKCCCKVKIDMRKSNFIPIIKIS